MLSLTEGMDRRLKWGLAALAGFLLFAAFTVWGGLPSGPRALSFWIQIVVLFLVTAAYVFIAWHLLARQIARPPRSVRLSMNIRQNIALLLAGGVMALVVGALWDELWHRRYGIPLGEDFFWRPHLLMYFGFGVGVLIGFWALSYLNRRLKGTFQQRFRANAIVGLLILQAAFLVYAVPADPIWHGIYGDDLSAWSVPHLLLLVAITMMILLAVFSHLPPSRSGEWRSILNIRPGDVLPLLMFAAILLAWLQVLMIDWDQALAGNARESWGSFVRNGCWRPICWGPSSSLGYWRCASCAALARPP